MAKTTKTWIVTTSGDRPLQEVAKDLTARGFKVGEVLSEIGCITGEGGADVVRKARKIKGVADVSANAPIHVGPPNARDTW